MNVVAVRPSRVIRSLLVVADVNAINFRRAFKRLRRVVPAIDVDIGVARHVNRMSDFRSERAVNVRRRRAVNRAFTGFGGMDHVMMRGQMFRVFGQHYLQQRDRFDRARLRRAVAFVAGHQRQGEKELRFEVVRIERDDLSQRFLIRLGRAQKSVVLNGRPFALITRLDSGNIKSLALTRFGGQLFRAFNGLRRAASRSPRPWRSPTEPSRIRDRAEPRARTNGRPRKPRTSGAAPAPD